MRENRQYIIDMIEAIDKILIYTQDLTYENFLHDSKTFDAVMHNFLIIGEAANNISDDIKKKYVKIDWRGIIGLRNIIAHGYFSINHEIVWKTIKERLPELKELLYSVHL